MKQTRGFKDGEYQDGELRGITFVAGRRGFGKTTLVANLLSSCTGGTIFFDSLSRHETALAGSEIVSQPGELEEYLRANRGHRYRALYQPRIGEVDDHFRAACIIVRAFGWTIFGIDELDMLCGPRYGDSRMPPELYHLVNYGRHCRVSMLATARYPMSVPRGFTSQCFEMRLFGMTEPDHLKYFERYIGKADAARLSSLPKFEYLHWIDGQPAQLKGGSK